MPFTAGEFQSFDIAGKIAIEHGDADKLLLRINKESRAAAAGLQTLEKQIDKTTVAFRKLNAASELSRQVTRSSKSIGTSIHQGLAQGISAGNANVSKATLHLVNGTINTAKRQLGIRSPSTVFAGIGNWIVRGLAQGISSNTGIAESAVSGLITGLTLTASTAAALGIKSVLLAGDLQVTTNALTVFTGSARLAKEELAKIDQVAQDTPGLRLTSAREGYQQLRALGFQAEISRGFIKELGEEKILSGASDEALNRIIFNFSQIASGGQKVSQELREIVTAMPTLKRAFEEAFGTSNPLRIQEFFDKDTEGAFKRLVDAMARGEAASGGFNDALGKSADAFIKAGQTFGTPILDPLTGGIQDLTGYLNSNQKAWESWGQTVGDVITGIRLPSKPSLTAKESGEAFNRGEVTFGEHNLNVWREGITEILGWLNEVDQKTKDVFGSPDRITTYFQELEKAGKQQREKTEELFAPFKDRFRAGDLRADNTINFRPGLGQTEAEREARARQDTLDTNNARKAEQLRKEQIEFLKASSAESISILKNRYETEQALLDSYIRNTIEDELNYIRRSSKFKQDTLKAELVSIKGYYDKLIKLEGEGTDEAKRLASERNVKVSDVSAQIRIEELRAQKQIAEQERRIFDERRKNQIEFDNLRIRAIQQSNAGVLFEIERGLSQTNIGFEAAFDEQIRIANQSLAQITQINREQLRLQLNDKTLTKEATRNLIKQANLEEQRLLQENNQKIYQINRERYERQKQQINEIFDYQDKIRGGKSAIASRISGDVISGLPILDFYENFADQLRFEKAEKQDVLRGEIEDFNKDLQNLLSDSAAANQSVLSKYIGADARTLETFFKTEIGGRGALIQILEKQKADIGKVSGFIKEGVGDIADLSIDLSKKFGALTAENLLDFRLGFQKGEEERQLVAFDSQIKRLEELQKKARAAGETFEEDKIQFQIDDAELAKAEKLTEFAQKRLDLIRESADGQRVIFESLKAGGIEAILVQEATRNSLAKEQVELQKQIIAQKYELANSPLISAQAIEIAQLGEISRLRQELQSAAASRVITGNRVSILNNLARQQREQALLEKQNQESLLKLQQASALARVAGLENEQSEKERILKEYAEKFVKAERDYQDKLRNITTGTDAVRPAASAADRRDNSPFGSTIAGGIRGLFGQGGVDDAIDGVAQAAQALGHEFAHLGGEEEARLAAQKEVWRDYGNTVVGVFGQMAQAAESVLATFILTGEGGADAIKSLVAQTIASVAVESAVKAIFQTAEGFAALARYDLASAAGHFTSAKIYGAVALGAGAVGLGIGLAGGLNGKKSSAYGGNASANGGAPPDYYTSPPTNQQQLQQNQQITPQQVQPFRFAERSQGNQSNEMLLQEIRELRKSHAFLAEAVSGLNSNIDSMSPGNVVSKGIRGNESLIGDTVVRDMQVSHSKVKKLSELIYTK